MIPFPIFLGSYLRILQIYAEKQRKPRRIISNEEIGSIFLGSTYNKASISRYFSGKSHPFTKNSTPDPSFYDPIPDQIRKKYLIYFSPDIIKNTEKLRSALLFLLTEKDFEITCSNGQTINALSFKRISWTEELLASFLTELFREIMELGKPQKIDPDTISKHAIEDFFEKSGSWADDRIYREIRSIGETLYNNTLIEMTGGTKLDEAFLGKLKIVPPYPKKGGSPSEKKLLNHIPYERDCGLYLLMGDKFSGHTAHLLYVWNKYLKTEDSVVYYVPRDINLSIHGTLFNYLFGTYLKNLVDTKVISQVANTGTAFDRANSGLRKLNKKIYLFIDGDENMDPRFMESIIKAYTQKPSFLANVFIVISVSNDFKDERLIGHKPTALSIKSLSSQSVKNILTEHGFNPNDVAPDIRRLLRSPKLMTAYLHADHISSLISERDETNVMMVIMQSYLGNSDTMKTFRERLLPAITLTAIREGTTAITPELVIDTMEELDLDTTPRLVSFNKYFVDPAKHLPFMFRQRGNNYYWKNEIWKDYYYALGCYNDFYWNSSKIGLLSFSSYIQMDKLLMMFGSDRKKMDLTSLVPHFRRLHFLVELLHSHLRPSKLEYIKHQSYEEWFQAYAALAMMCDYRGERVQEATYSNYALDLYEKEMIDPRAFSSLDRLPEMLCSMCYFVNKGYGREMERAHRILLGLFEKYGEDPILREEKGLLVVKTYGNIGASYQRNQDYEKAEEQYKLRLKFLNELIHLYATDEIPQDLIDCKHQSYIQFASNAFHQGDFKAGIKHHNDAINYGLKHNCQKTYISYSRLVGCWIEALRQRKWTIADVKRLLNNLKDGIEFMQNTKQTLDTNELNNISQKKETILQFMDKNSIPADKEIESLLTIIDEAEDRFNQET